MFKESALQNFVQSMEKAITEQNKVYGDTWKTQDISFLEQRLSVKMNEFKLTRHPRKLISLANLAMLLYVRMKEANGSVE